MSLQNASDLKVVVSVHGRWHGFDLAEGLYQKGYLARLLTTYPASVAGKFLPPGVPLMSAPWLELRRRFYDKFRIGSKPDLAIAKAFGKFGQSGCFPGVMTDLFFRDDFAEDKEIRATCGEDLFYFV